MEKRTLLALGLSFLVLAFYPLVLKKFYPQYGKSAPAAQTHAKTPAARSIPSAPVPSSVEYVPAEDLEFKNQKIRLVFNQKDAGIRQVSFFDFVDSTTGQPLVLFSLKESQAVPTALALLGGKDAPVAGTYQGQVGTDSVLFKSAPAGAIQVAKHYRFDPSGYSGNLNIVFENSSDSPFELQYELFAGTSIPARHAIDSQYLEANFFLESQGRKSIQHVRETGSGKRVESQGPVEWVAVKDRHFSVLLKPKSQGLFSGLVRGLGDHRMSVSLVSAKTVVPAHGSASHDFLFYIGPNEVKELLPLDLDAIVNFGKLDAIGKLLVGGLELLNKAFRNYGLAIIALTVLINLLFFPLTKVSYMSMKRMQLLQPQMNKLKEQHKKSPEKLHKETMDLYKKHKVNPFGGCLPMLLQMPVFMALYVALSKSVILIDSGLLWIKDLSSPDGLPLPFVVPFVGKEIHILPLIMVAAMFFQQKLTTIKMEGQDPAIESQQKMMTLMMPIVFGFIFYSMPSGLVLYWLTNTLLMTFYQLRLKNMTLT